MSPAKIPRFWARGTACTFAKSGRNRSNYYVNIMNRKTENCQAQAPGGRHVRQCPTAGDANAICNHRAQDSTTYRPRYEKYLGSTRTFAYSLYCLVTCFRVVPIEVRDFRTWQSGIAWPDNDRLTFSRVND